MASSAGRSTPPFLYFHTCRLYLYIDFGVSLTGKNLQVTPAANGGGFQGVTAIQLCGSPPQGATCFQAGTDDDHHVFVYTTATDSATETDQFFYVAAF